MWQQWKAYPSPLQGLLAGLGDRMAMEAPDPLRQILDRSMQSNNLYQHPLPASGIPYSCSSGLCGCTSCLLGPLPHLSSFALQSVHSLLSPLGSRCTEVSTKMVLGPRAHIFLITLHC
uniref:Uncharacterized protein n=1 Tax=Castor canadensis TaxID=51338 RepID=A0A8C0W3U8_CASCN